MSQLERLILAVENHLRGQNFGSVWCFAKTMVLPILARRCLRSTAFRSKAWKRFLCSISKSCKVLSKYGREEIMKLLKYHHNVLLCRVFRDAQRPPEPWTNTPKVYFGWIKIFIFRRIASNDKGFIYSLQKGAKQCWPEVSNLQVLQAMRKHRSFLERKMRCLPSDLSNGIRNTAQEVYDPILNGSIKLTRLQPTNKSCSQVTADKGGSMKLTFSKFDLSKYLRVYPFEKADWYTSWCVRDFSHSRLQRLRADFEASKALNYQYAVHRSMEGFRNSLESPLGVRMVPLKEPGKVRLISVGCGFLKTALQPLQNAQLKCWSRTNVSTMCDNKNNLIEKIQNMHTVLHDLPCFVSADYSSATDSLKKLASFLSTACLLGMPEGRLAFLSFLPHGITYPEVFKEGSDELLGKVEKLIAEEGQMMGHSLSFASLCIVNLSVYRVAIRRWVTDCLCRNERLRRLEIAKRMWDTVLVNGDDLAFKCERHFFKIFNKTAADAGFIPSPGKNYISPDTIMINSQLFTLHQGAMKRLGYLPQRLITGTLSEEQTPVSLARDLNMMGRFEKLIGPCIPLAMSRFDKSLQILRGKCRTCGKGKCKKSCKETKTSFSLTLNYRLPVHLGGLGLSDSHFSKPNKVTKLQRKLAAVLVNDPSLSLYHRWGSQSTMPDLSDFKLKDPIFVKRLPRGGLPPQPAWEWALGVQDPYRRDIVGQTPENQGWLNYFRTIHQFSCPPKGKTLKTKILDVIRNNNFWRMKPMSDEKISLYKDYHWWYRPSDLPTPPILPLVMVGGPSVTEFSTLIENQYRKCESAHFTGLSV